MASAALALVLLATACSDGDTTTESAAAESTTSTPGAGTEAPMDIPTDPPADVAPGTYDLGAIGLHHVTFDADDGPWHVTKVGPAGPGPVLSDQMVILSATPTALEGRRNVVLSRPTHLLDPSFIGPPLPAGIDPDEDLIPVDAIDAWLVDAEAGSEWGVTDVESVEISGLAATRFALEPDFVGCENMEALAPGIRDDWTGCNGLVAWDIESEDGLGRISVEGWDGGRNEYLWIHDVGDGPLVVSIHLGYDLDEEWNARARALLDSVAVA